VAPASAPAEEGIVDGPLEDTVSTYIKTTSLKIAVIVVACGKVGISDKVPDYQALPAFEQV